MTVESPGAEGAALHLLTSRGSLPLIAIRLLEPRHFVGCFFLVAPFRISVSRSSFAPRCDYSYSSVTPHRRPSYHFPPLVRPRVCDSMSSFVSLVSMRRCECLWGETLLRALLHKSAWRNTLSTFLRDRRAVVVSGCINAREKP
ncbi:hypothetical protein TRVL_02713 [Trypanosoma vivax]|nr:hypothetical protein TRVL_02713 [Trypanosoma vivax]